MLEVSSTSSLDADLAAVKSRQRAAWSAGDYAVVGTTLQIVGETLCEALDLRAGERVIDIAAGNGNATLAARRGHCLRATESRRPRAREGTAGSRVRAHWPS